MEKKRRGKEELTAGANWANRAPCGRPCRCARARVGSRNHMVITWLGSGFLSFRHGAESRQFLFLRSVACAFEFAQSRAQYEQLLGACTGCSSRQWSHHRGSLSSMQSCTRCTCLCALPRALKSIRYLPIQVPR